jgi:hypothetical protein
MKAFALVALLAFGVVAVAGEALDRAGIVARLEASEREVWLYARTVNDRAQADALRRAIVERGVVVTLLVAPPTLEVVCDPGATACRRAPSDRDSYAYSLAFAGARLFEARVPGDPSGFALLDRRVALEGPGVGIFTAGAGAQVLQPERAGALHAWFLDTLSDRTRSRVVTASEIVRRIKAQGNAR